MRKPVLTLLLISAAGAAVPAAATAAPTTVRGTVVDRAHDGKRFTLAPRSGRLVTVAVARRAPAVGSRVLVKGTGAARGLRAKRVKVRGKARRATLRGLVTVRRGAARSYVVAGRAGAGVEVEVARRTRAGRGAAARSGLPRVGTLVEVDVSFSGDGDLRQEDLDVVGHHDEFEIEGILTAVDAQARTLTLLPTHDADDADHDGEDGDSPAGHDHGDEEDEPEAAAPDGHDGHEIVVHVPAAFDMSLCSVGQEVELEVRFANGRYLLTDSGDSDRSEDRSSSGDESDHAHDRSVSNACGDADESSDGSSGPGHGDSSSDSSED